MHENTLSYLLFNFRGWLNDQSNHRVPQTLCHRSYAPDVCVIIWIQKCSTTPAHPQTKAVFFMLMPRTGAERVCAQSPRMNDSETLRGELLLRTAAGDTLLLSELQGFCHLSTVWILSSPVEPGNVFPIRLWSSTSSLKSLTDWRKSFSTE